MDGNYGHFIVILFIQELFTGDAKPNEITKAVFLAFAF